MGNALGGETTIVGDELLILKHTVNVPARLLVVDASFLSPWFSNERLAREDLHWRILLSTRSSNSRRVEVQAATSEQRVSSQSQTTELIIESIAVDFKWGPRFCRLTYTGVRDFLTTGTWIGVGQLVESETSTRPTDANVRIIVHIQLLKTAQRVAMDQPPAACIWPTQEQREHCKKVLNHMLEGGAFTDVTLKLEKEELRVHRSVLSASSPVFEAMFKHDNFIENQIGEVSIEDIRPGVMRVALQHMYGADMKDLNSEMSMDLLHVADKYQISSLRRTCEDYLLGDSSVDVLKVLVSAYDNNASRMKDMVLMRILNNPSVIKNETLDMVAFTHPHVVADVLKILAQK